MLIKLDDNVNKIRWQCLVEGFGLVGRSGLVEGFGLVGESGSIGRSGAGKDGITQEWGLGDRFMANSTSLLF